MCVIFFSIFLFLVLDTIHAKSISETVILSVEWEEYKMRFHKHYDSFSKEENHFETFKRNKLKSAKHNRLYAEGRVTYEMGLNQFSDMTMEEMAQIFAKNNAGMLTDSRIGNEIFWSYDNSVNPDLPDSIDWRAKGAVTPVKNQGNCSSCWAFAAIGVVEAQHFIKHKKLVELSEQNLLDCCAVNNGCDGGSRLLAFNYIKKNGGVDTEASYPYKGIQQDCNFQKNSVGSNLTSFFKLPIDETTIKKYVAWHGPVSAGITVMEDFFRYQNGVYSNPNCTSKMLHALLIVGYGNDEKGNPYWLLKNSWGPAWGDKGYGKIARGSNMCTIADLCIVAEGG